MSMAELLLTPALLAEMVGLIDADTISGKIAKQILPDLFTVNVIKPSILAFCRRTPGLGSLLRCLTGRIRFRRGLVRP